MVKLYHWSILPSVLGLALITTTTPVKAQTTPPCAATGTSITNLTVCSASYLGGSSKDNGASVDIAPDKTVVVAGTISGNNFQKIPINLITRSSITPGGNGAIIRTDSTGKNILSVTRIGNVIDEIDVNRSTGNIAVVGDFGLALLNNTASRVLWSKNLGAGGGAIASKGRRVAVGSNGEIAVLFNKTVYVFSDASGTNLGQFSVTPKGNYALYVEDVAIDSASKTVVVTGFSQKNDGSCAPEQVPFIRGYSYTGTLKWTDYDWSDQQTYNANQSCADSRGERVKIGRDGKLYFAAEAAGGNNIFRYDPQNLGAGAPNVFFDEFNNPYNTSSAHFTYYARLDPATGIIQKGQYAISRIVGYQNDLGNTIVPKAITADEKGNVYLSGYSAYEIANRSNLHISSQPVGIYEHDGEGFVLVVPPDFNSRKVWTVWTGQVPTDTTAGSTFYGVAASNGVAAIVGTTNEKMITVNPIQASNAGGDDAFFSVFPATP